MKHITNKMTNEIQNTKFFSFIKTNEQEKMLEFFKKRHFTELYLKLLFFIFCCLIPFGYSFIIYLFANQKHEQQFSNILVVTALSELSGFILSLLLDRERLLWKKGLIFYYLLSINVYFEFIFLMIGKLNFPIMVKLTLINFFNFYRFFNLVIPIQVIVFVWLFFTPSLKLFRDFVISYLKNKVSRNMLFKFLFFILMFFFINIFLRKLFNFRTIDNKETQNELSNIKDFKEYPFWQSLQLIFWGPLTEEIKYRFAIISFFGGFIGAILSAIIFVVIHIYLNLDWNFFFVSYLYTSFSLVFLYFLSEQNVLYTFIAHSVINATTVFTKYIPLIL